MDILELIRSEITNVYPGVDESISEVMDHLEVDHIIAVGDVFGRPCYNPGSFQVF